MIIGVDLDDTLTRLIKGFIKAGKEYCKANGIKKAIINRHSEQIDEIFGFDENQVRDVWFNFFFEALNNYASRPGASQVMKSLKERGHTIYIVTARDFIWHRNPYQESYDWLVKNDIPFDKIFLCKEGSKCKVCKDEKIDVFLDDYPANFNGFEGNTHTKKFIMDACHNLDFQRDDVVRVKTWRQFNARVKELEKEKKN